MNAKNSDMLRIQEIYDLVSQTQLDIAEVGMTKERFLEPHNKEDILIREGLENRVFRIAEEGGKLGVEAEGYGFDRKAMSGLRNILAHVYAQVDHRIIWNVIVKEFPALLVSCKAYCLDQGFDLKLSKQLSEAELDFDKGRTSDAFASLEHVRTKHKL